MGVAELMNKIGGMCTCVTQRFENTISSSGRYFTSYDEELAKAFSVYCGISIYHVRV